MLARNLSALLVALVLVFGIGRPLLTRRSALKAEETALMQERKTAIGAEISPELHLSAVAAPNLPVTLHLSSEDLPLWHVCFFSFISFFSPFLFKLILLF